MDHQWSADYRLAAAALVQGLGNGRQLPPVGLWGNVCKGFSCSGGVGGLWGSKVAFLTLTSPRRLIPSVECGAGHGVRTIGKGDCAFLRSSALPRDATHCSGSSRRAPCSSRPPTSLIRTPTTMTPGEGALAVEDQPTLVLELARRRKWGARRPGKSDCAGPSDPGSASEYKC